MTEVEKVADDVERVVFEFLSRHYVQRADDRQKAMGLQYTTAETHDLAKQATRAALAAHDSAMGERDRALRDFGACVFDVLFEEFCEGAYEVEIEGFIHGDAVKCGLVEKTKFDPERHEDNIGIGMEAGDDWWCLTSLGSEARRATLAKGSDQQ